MDKYFLMGFDSIKSFKDGGAQGLLNEKGQDSFTIIKYNERTSLLKDLMDALMGWDCYIEIFYNDVKEIESEKNKRQWLEFFKMIDPNDEMSDGQFIDYMMDHYKVPEFLHLDEL
jgi:hypothetical protein